MLWLQTQVIHKRVTKINVLTQSQVVGSYIVPQTSISDRGHTLPGTSAKTASSSNSRRWWHTCDYDWRQCFCRWELWRDDAPLQALCPTAIWQARDDSCFVHTLLSIKVIFTQLFSRVMDGCGASMLILIDWQLVPAKPFFQVSEVMMASVNSAQLQASVPC